MGISIANIIIFLSTPSARRATVTISGLHRGGIFLSTPSARRATGADVYWEADPTFLSTPSARRATIAAFLAAKRVQISIHALREEGDQGLQFLCPQWRHFYPRPPRGGRRGILGVLNPTSKFLSTPSARRATAKTERKPSAFVSLYTSLHKLQRGAFKTNRKITPLLAQTAVIPVRSVQKNHVRFLFALAGYHPDIKRAAHYPVQTPGAVQRARPWSGNCCPAGRTADCPRQGRSGRSALP